ncbi:MAG: hypothetical protein ABI604_14215 [Nitrospirota bacterium]
MKGSLTLSMLFLVLSGGNLDLLAPSSRKSRPHDQTPQPLVFVAWLQKPVGQSRLRDCLHGYRQGSVTAPTVDGPQPLTPPVLGIRVLLVEGNPVNREVATGDARIPRLSRGQRGRWSAGRRGLRRRRL